MICLSKTSFVLQNHEAESIAILPASCCLPLFKVPACEKALDSVWIPHENLDEDRQFGLKFQDMTRIRSSSAHQSRKTQESGQKDDTESRDDKVDADEATVADQVTDEPKENETSGGDSLEVSVFTACAFAFIVLT